MIMMKKKCLRLAANQLTILKRIKTGRIIVALGGDQEATRSWRFDRVNEYNCNWRKGVLEAWNASISGLQHFLKLHTLHPFLLTFAFCTLNVLTKQGKLAESAIFFEFSRCSRGQRVDCVDDTKVVLRLVAFFASSKVYSIIKSGRF